MSGQMKTPGVYIDERDAFPSSVVGVETAVPAFVGYSEKAEIKGKPLHNIPVKITSPAEYAAVFGGPAMPKFQIMPQHMPPGPQRARPVTLSSGEFTITRADPPDRQYLLWQAVQMFFTNGGTACWIVSVGEYADAIALGDAASGLIGGLTVLQREAEPALLVVPDAVRLPPTDCAALHQAMLRHCGHEMQSRFAILDLRDGDQARQRDDVVAAFRSGVGDAHLGFGAAYYPWLNMALLVPASITYRSFVDDRTAATRAASVDALLAAIVPGNDAAKAAALLALPIDDLHNPAAKVTLDQFLKTAVPAVLTDLQQHRIAQANHLLVQNLRSFTPVLAEALRQVNILPPGGAMAGLYATVDADRGVWKAPANIGVAGAISPTVPIANAQQDDLNGPLSGKSVNAIRAFPGKGLLVWGARTLDGNSAEWRYINVRRTVMYVEQSCRLAIQRFVFEPNDANTWVTIKALIENFLQQLWMQGGLAGSKPQEAFAVRIGAGQTMTSTDIAAGILRVQVMLAIARPAEYIVISFQQQMQPA